MAENPKVEQVVKSAVAEAAKQGGTSREGTSESPQRGAGEQADGGRSGN